MANIIKVQGAAVTVKRVQEQDYISLTDIARYKDAQRTDYLIMNWLRNRNTIEFLGIWEHLNNPTFNPIEFDGIRAQAGLNSFILTVKSWMEKTGAIASTHSDHAGLLKVGYAERIASLHLITCKSVDNRQQGS